METKETYWPRHLANDQQRDEPYLAVGGGGTPRVNVEIKGDAAECQMAHKAIKDALTDVGAELERTNNSNLEDNNE